MAIERSVGASCTLRTRFIQVLHGRQPAWRGMRGRRNRAKASLERKAQILDEVLSEAGTGGVVIVSPLKPQVEATLGKRMALCTLYAMLAGHGWRKRAPNKRHVQAGWKKTADSASRGKGCLPNTATFAFDVSGGSPIWPP